MPDYPDYTKPITITGVTIETLPIDIKAQTIENIAIDIAAITSTASLNINITGGVSDIRMGKLINPDFEEDSVGWVLKNGAEITDTMFYTGYKCVRIPPETYGEIDQAGISPPIDTNKIASFKICQFVANILDYTGVTLYYTDGTTEDTVLTPTQANKWEAHDINYSADKFIAEIWCGMWEARSIAAVWIDSVFISWSIDAYTSIVSSVQLNINIAAQAVDINIKTSGGVNLVIDKLTQTAYVEDRRTLSNNGATPSWGPVTGTNRAGKFFPRGCRGFIGTIDVYCKDIGAGGGTITVYITPHPSMGYVASADVTVPAAGPAAWRSATFNRMWNYDSLFIFVVSDSANCHIAYDAVEKPDEYTSSDSGATWTAGVNRLWFRAVMKAMTVGDLPVSGTVNTIKIPDSGSYTASDAVAVVEGSEVTLLTIVGSGHMLYARFKSPSATKSHLDHFRIYCDGNIAFAESHLTINGDGYTTDSPVIQSLAYAADGVCKSATDLRFQFRRELKVTVEGGAGMAAHTALVRVKVNLIR